MFTVLSCALIAGIDIVDVISDEIESESESEAMVCSCDVVSSCDMFGSL
jgi:hypothetical protein